MMSHSPKKSPQRPVRISEFEGKNRYLFGKEERDCMTLNEERFEEFHPFFKLVQELGTLPSSYC